MEKRIFDFLMALMLLVFFMPLSLLIAAQLFLFYGGKIFYIQERIGKNGRVFSIIKFKTMTDKWNIQGLPLPDEERMTRFGYWLRALSLDELPQLVNVLKGDMSLIGPRPLLVEYGPLYNNFQKRRHEVLPGITGWAQVNGRNGLNWQEKFQHDVWYVENRSFMLDLKIICMTIGPVFLKKNIGQPGHLTCEKFQGETSILGQDSGPYDRH
ncbi:MAG: sugar transferase [Cyclobacteriaceae bacterium]